MSLLTLPATEIHAVVTLTTREPSLMIARAAVGVSSPMIQPAPELSAMRVVGRDWLSIHSSYLAPKATFPSSSAEMGDVFVSRSYG